MTRDHPAQALVHFFKQVPGCVFASSFVSKGADGRISFTTFWDVDEGAILNINGHLDGCGDSDRAACVVFPGITSAKDLVALLMLLNTDERWRCRRWKPASTSVRLEWRTRSGSWSQTLGLAPLFSMPATRRTPYLAIALWPGKPKKAKNAKDWVGFIDMPSKLEPTAHRRALVKSTDTARAILGDDAGEHWRQVAFRFPGALAERFAADW